MSAFPTDFPPRRGTIRDYAACYLAARWSIFPLAPLSKRPSGKALPKDDNGKPTWKQYQEQRATLRDVDEWLRAEPDMNLAVATGPISDLALLDLDGPEAIANLKAAGAQPPKTLLQKSPHGWHGFYRLGGRRIHNSAGLIAPKVDTRGIGGYVVIAPSRLSDAGYTWHPQPLPLADAPEWMEFPERLQPLQAQSAQLQPQIRGRFQVGHEAWVRDALANGVPEGQRNQMAARLAGYFHSKGLPDDLNEHLLLALFAPRCAPPLQPREVQEVVQSVARYPVRERGDGGVLVL